MSLDYAVYDVFTDTKLAGNPLAVVFDADQFDTEQMQKIAGEFNLSETVFIRTPKDDMADAALRIFTPKKELPFAGHPTVGAAIAIAERTGAPQDVNMILQEEAGLVPCSVRFQDGLGFTEFAAPSVPVRSEINVSDDEAAALVGLSPHEIGFKTYGVSAFGVGHAFLYIPVHDLDVVARAKAMSALSDPRFAFTGVFVFCRRSLTKEASFHGRMFAPKEGIPEDPATGSAVVGLAAAMMTYEPPQDGVHRHIIEQGYEMGRPSHIHLTLDVKSGALNEVRIGGNAIKLMSGTLDL